MIDVEFKKFYDNVKDPTWPDIRNYVDFVKLPATIRNECKTLHNLDQRKNQIEDRNYWSRLTVSVYQYQNLVYMPVKKCAHTYYTQVFESLGFQKTQLNNINLNEVSLFGLILHPFTRWSKGITEWVCSEFGDLYIHDEEFLLGNQPRLHNNIDVDHDKLKKNADVCRLIRTVIVGDVHTVPYTSTFGDILHQINWIPMDYFSSDNDIKLSLMSFFNSRGHDIKLPLDNARAGTSSANKIKLQNFIDKLFLENNETNESIYHLYKMYADDLKFYHNLIDNFTPNWQHI